jgi:hypothetical protein
MLPEFYRFRVRNETDQTFTYDNQARIEVHITPWKMTSGAMAQGTIISDTTDFLNTGENVAANGEVEGASHDNTTLLHIGFTGTFYAKADQNSTDGTLDLYMEISTDNSRWPSDLADFDITKHCILLGRLEFSTDAEDEDAAISIEY